MDIYAISPLTRENAGRIISWRYPAPYDLYDLTPESLEGLLEPAYRYHQVLDPKDKLVGFCCFGGDARVPGGNYSQLDPEVLDIGIGLKPELTGQGRGRNFVSAVLEYGASTYQPEKFRAAIAGFNLRSLKTFQNLGFVITNHFWRELIEIDFYQLEKPRGEGVQ